MSDTIPRDVAAKFALQQEHFRDLRRYILCGIRLPQTLDEYRKEFALHKATIEKMEDRIEQLLVLYKTIRTHCLEFQEETFKPILDFVKEVKNYSQRVVNFHPVIYKFLASAKEGRGSDLADDQERVQLIITRDKVFFERALTKAGKALSGIEDFWTKTVGHEGAVSREMISLENDLQNSKAEETTLTHNVNGLKDLIAGLQKASETSPQFSSLASEGKCWMPLVGWIPKALIQTPSTAQKHVKAIYECLGNLNTDEESLSEVICLQSHLMKTSLEKIHDLLTPAQKSVELFIGFFESLQNRLALVEEATTNIQETSALWKDDIQVDKDAWHHLSGQVQHFMEVAYLTEVDAKSVLPG